MSSWQDRVRSQMKALELTQEELAQKMSITRGAITHYLSGRRVPPLKQFQKMATILKVEPSWLQFGVQGGTTSKKPIDSHKTTPAHHPIPLLSWEQATKYRGLNESQRQKHTDFLPNIFTDQAHWYALTVQGDSMKSQNGRRTFNAGDTIIIDAQKKPAHGCFVVANINGVKEAAFKEYVIDSGTHYLKPLNPQYPLIKIDSKTKIIGIVVSKYEVL